MSEAWSLPEVELVVADYFAMRVFASAPRMYPLTGALDQVCRLEPQSFVARVG